MSWIDGDNQVDRNALGLQHFRELQRAKPAHRMSDEGNRSGIVAVIANCLLGNEAANRELVDVRPDAGVFEPFSQAVHSARVDRTKSAT